jgi:hypothetical protein
MSTTTIAAKPPRPLRLNQKAELIPAAQFARWHTIASATAGLSSLERALLDGLAEHYRQLQERGYAGRLSIERMALDLDAVKVTNQCCPNAMQPTQGIVALISTLCHSRFEFIVTVSQVINVLRDCIHECLQVFCILS